MKQISVYLLIALFSSICGLQLPAAETPPNEQTQPPAATPAPPPSAPAKRSAAELEKLVMPIALHPDPLISILLPASAYPLEIIQAARFVKDTNNIPKVDEQSWDDNVKELAKFPDLIAKMDADLAWTMDLGQAFIDQPKEVMDAIQDLRTKAKKAGTLQNTSQQIVTVTNIVVQETNITEVVNVTKEIVQVAPANPEVIYVPSYPPTVYYPPPAYVYNPLAPLVTFGAGMAMGAIIANNCNWNGGSVDVDVNRNVNRNSNRNTDRNTSRSGNRASSTGAKSGSQKWQPNQSRMQQSGAKASANTRDSRGWSSSGAKPSTGNMSSRPSTGNAGARPSTGSAGSGASARPSTSQSRGSSPSASSRSSSGGSAFSGAGSGSGSSARSSSSRGSSSRSGGGGGGGGSRGGGGGGRR